MEFCIGVELEGLWKGKPGFHLPVNDKEHKQFAEALVPVYNKIRDEDMLRAIFIAGSHPGRLPNDKSQWNVTIDGAIGEAADMMGESLFKGRTYSTTFCGVAISIGLTTIQIRLNSSLQK